MRDNMYEVFPVLKHEGVLYKRIKIEELTADSLRTFLLFKHCKKPNVVNMDSFLIYGYENHLPLFISKENGRLYSPTKPTYQSSLDAIRLLRILHEAAKEDGGLVEGFERWQRNTSWNMGNSA